MGLQHCCWASHQIAEQVTIVNLVALRGSSGIFYNNSENRIGDKALYIIIYKYIYIYNLYIIIYHIYTLYMYIYNSYIIMYIMACRLFDFPSYYKKNSRPTQSHQIDYCNLRCSAIWYEAQQQCWGPIATFEKEHMCYLCSWLCIYD